MTFRKTQREVEDIMKSVAKLLLEVTDDKTVRIPYGASSKTGSAPPHSPESKVCYVHVTPTDDGYGQKHHISYINGATESDGMTEVDEYTEEYAVIFSCYGPECYDRARAIRDGLYGIAVHRLLVKERIHLKPGIPPIVQTHDLVNTQWVQRCDVHVTFYSTVRVERANAVQNIENVRITLNVKGKSLAFGARDRE